MQSLADCLPSNASKPTSSAPERTTKESSTRPSASLADYLWLHMGAAFGHRWTSAYGEESRGTAGRLWAAELAGMSRAEIDAGLAKCRSGSDPWPPSLPEFKAHCLGIPSFAEVNRQLLTDTDRTPFARMVWQHVDPYAHRHASAKDAERMRKDAYAVAAEARMRGEPLPDAPAAAIEHAKPAKPHGIPETEEARRARLAKLLRGVEL